MKKCTNLFSLPGLCSAPGRMGHFVTAAHWFTQTTSVFPEEEKNDHSRETAAGYS